MYETAFAVVIILCGIMELLKTARYQLRTSAIKPEPIRLRYLDREQPSGPDYAQRPSLEAKPSPGLRQPLDPLPVFTMSNRKYLQIFLLAGVK